MVLFHHPPGVACLPFTPARAAIGGVCNAIFTVRQPDLWGEATTACASDAKKFGAWDQNLMTEWHARYGGPGIMVYLSEASDNLSLSRLNHRLPGREAHSEVV